ncbi:MAG: hypothetical protein AAF743_03340 [Planctomycetota bacterium]
MRSFFVVATAAVFLSVVGCQPKQAQAPQSAEMPSDLRASAGERAASLQRTYAAEVPGAKVGVVTEVKTLDGDKFIAADVTGVPNGALAVVIDSAEQRIGIVRAFNGADGQTFFEVIDASRPIVPGDFVVRFPEGTAVELQPIEGAST